MAYSSNGYRRGNNRQTSGRRSPSGSRPQNRRGRSGQGTRSGSSSRTGRGHSSTGRSRSRNLTGPDTGYTLHSHRVSYSRRGGSPSDLINGRFILLVVIVIVVVVVLVAGISSCVRGSSSQANSQQTDEQTEQKPRVASGLSSDLTQRFNEVLDRDDQMAQIAQNADQYDDDRLLTLALNEPEAVSFVANYPTADKSASSYTDEVTKGQVPQLYDWDTRWGYVTYGNGCIGVTGSAPTTVAMAYMGLTGKNDKTPATIAQGVVSTSSSSNGNANSNSNASNRASNTNNSANSNGNSSSNTSNTGSAASDSAESMIALMNQAGLSATQYDSSSSTLVNCLSSTSVAAVYIKQDGLESNRDAHWALVVGMNEDGSLNVFDPTSSMVSTHTWASSTVASASSTILYVTVSDTAASSESGSSTTDSGYSDYDEEGSSSTSSNGNNASSSSSGVSSNANTSSRNSNSQTGNGNASSSSSSGASSSGDYVGL